MKLNFAPRHAAIAFVVIGMGVLYGTLREPWRKALRTNQSSNCFSNLKQIGLAAQAYARDTNGQYPVAARWTDDLQPYVEIGEMERTPKNLDRAFRCATTGEFYVFNSYLARHNFPSAFVPTIAPLAFCAREGERNLTDDGSLWPLEPIHEMGSRSGNIVVFADAHVKMMEAKPDFRAFTSPQLTPSRRGTP